MMDPIDARGMFTYAARTVSPVAIVLCSRINVAWAFTSIIGQRSQYP